MTTVRRSDDVLSGVNPRLVAFGIASMLKIPSLARWRRTLVLLALSGVRRLQ